MTSSDPASASYPNRRGRRVPVSQAIGGYRTPRRASANSYAASAAKPAARHFARKDEVVVIAAEEFRRLKDDQTGEALIAALQASPDRSIDIEPQRTPMPVRPVEL